MSKPKPMYGWGPDSPEMHQPGEMKMTFSTKGKLTDEHLDSIATELIPLLDEVANMNADKSAFVFKDQPEADPDYKPPSQEDMGFTFKGDGDTGRFTLPGDEQLTWAIQGQAVMVTNIPEQREDGSYRIVLSSSENWVLKSVLMSGLDSSMEIELTLAPRI